MPFNPAENGNGSTIAFTLSNSNKTATQSSGSDHSMIVLGTTSHTTGAYYLEMTVTALGSLGYLWGLGIGPTSMNLTAIYSDTANTPPNACLMTADTTGQIACPAGGGGAVPVTIHAGDVIAMCVDIDNGRLWCNDLTQSTGWSNFTAGNFSGNPTAGTGGALMGLTGGLVLYPAFYAYQQPTAGTINTGTSAFTASPPSGFVSWDVTNVTTLPVWLYFGQSLALAGGAKLLSDLARNPTRSRRRMFTAGDEE